MKETTFRIRAYGWGELASLYNPDIQYSSAVKRLSIWVKHNPHLHTELGMAGWKKGSRILTPMQVKILIDYLGKPEE